MGKHRNSKARAVRLPLELWESIEAEAAAGGASVNEVIRRRLAGSFQPPPLRPPVTIEYERVQESALK